MSGGYFVSVCDVVLLMWDIYKEKIERSCYLYTEKIENNKLQLEIIFLNYSFTYTSFIVFIFNNLKLREATAAGALGTLKTPSRAISIFMTSFAGHTELSNT